jgi:lipopolysaccharide heptosyltransferase III
MPSELAHFYSRTRRARKVIVVDLGFLGDTIHLIPALWELKSAYPEAGLHVLTTPVGAEVLRLAACVDHAWAIEMQREKRTLRQQWQVIRGLRRERFDVAFNFSGADRTLFMTALSGARQSVAYPGGRRHFWNHWLIRNWAQRQARDRVVFEQRRGMLAACGLPLDAARFDLTIDPVAGSWATGIVPSFAMHLSLNASKATREWPLEHHRLMLEKVWKKFPELVVVASTGANERERQRLNIFARTMNDSRLKVMSEIISIPQLAALLRRCRLHLGPDSGVLHLAFALGLPTVSFFREQGDYKSFMPTGPRHRVISMPCHCVDHVDSPCERLGQAECFGRIEPGRVADLVCEELALGEPRRV